MTRSGAAEPVSFAVPTGQKVMSTQLPNEPRVVDRAEQPYAAIKRSVTMQSIGKVADRLPDVFGWLGARGIEPAGAPFFRYNVIDMERELEIEAGVPIAALVEGEGEILTDVLPAGRYATLTHLGHPDRLINANARLRDWAKEQGLTWDMTLGERGEHWGCRLELFNTDPSVEPDRSKWEIELVFRLAS